MSLDLMQLVRKRYHGDAWMVLSEVANSTGANVRRHADAIALGLWPSRGYELHGIEIKVSRGDVQRELAQPEKADAVGKYCDFWWLVVEDLKIIDGLVIPESWGVLYPKNGVLREHRKAPKRKDAKPFDRGFVAAVLRQAMKNYVARDEHEAFKLNARETISKELEGTRAWEQRQMLSERDELRSRIAAFEKVSGVSIDVDRWSVGPIGAAVKVVLEARRTSKHLSSPADLVRSELAYLDRMTRQHDQLAANLRDQRAVLETMVARLEREETAAPPADAQPAPEQEPADADDLSEWAKSVVANVEAADA